MADLLAASPSAKAAGRPAERGLGTMKSKNGTAVRLTCRSTAAPRPDEPNLTAAARLVEVVEYQRRRGPDWMTGANVMRPWAQPVARRSELQHAASRSPHALAGDERSACRQRRRLGSISQRADVPAKDDSDLVTGCLLGDVVPKRVRGRARWAAVLLQQSLRNPSTPWTADIQKCCTPAALKKRWHDFPRAGESWSHVAPRGGDDPRHSDFESCGSGSGWCSEMAGLIHGIDSSGA